MEEPKEVSMDLLSKLSPVVKATRDKIGPFEYDEFPIQDTVKRIKKDPVMLENGAWYEGEWNEETNERDGKGVQVWPDSSIYEGNRCNGEANGKGRLIKADGNVYNGEWKDDKAHGFGTSICSSGVICEGYWAEDK